MADTPNEESVYVTAEERVHPALQKIAHALIALARLRLAEEKQTSAEGREEHGDAPAADQPDQEVCHD